MSERLPAPDFDAKQYARPNLNWTCGNAAEGKPCPLGPDGRGRCQATFECKPLLEVKPGETKGRWRCTRLGGECETGPLPDGTCCKAIPKCSPVPSMRLQRGRFTRAVVVATFAALLILLGSSKLRNDFINPGQISTSHSGAAFASMVMTNHIEANCAACHVAGSVGLSGMVTGALHVTPGPLDIPGLLAAKKSSVTAIDESCEKCHTGHFFHQENATFISCTFCHQEHQGAKIAKTTDANCTFCHGDAEVMAVAASMRRDIRSGEWYSISSDGIGSVASPPPGPADGFTKIIHHFDTDHPEFRFIADNWRDRDTLKFNHAVHLTSSTIPKVYFGEKLDCTFCHRPDSAGAYMKPVNFQSNCRVCHSLQFDPETPGLNLPHGNPEAVTAFLHSLPKQYTDLAARNGIRNEDAQNQFAQAKLERLRTQFGSGAELEKRVFFSTRTTGPEVAVGTVSGNSRALFPGCAYCHEVKSATGGEPLITPPMIFDRWLAHGNFTHAKHTTVSCTQCHAAVQSKETSDILLPTQQSCATCHNPRSGVADSCATCHVFHKEPYVVR